MLLVCVGTYVLFHETKTLTGDETKSSKLVTDPIEQQKYCDVLFGNGYSEENIGLPFSCTYIAAASSTHLLNYSINTEDVLFVSDGSSTTVIEGGDFVRYVGLTDEIRLDINGNLMSLKDVTYDGYPDLAVRYSAGAYNFFYDYYAYDPKTHNFSPDPIVFDRLGMESDSVYGDNNVDIVNPEIDPINKTITSHMLGRGMGDIYQRETYQLTGKKYVLIKSESQNIINETDYSKDDVNTPSTYRRITFERKNGVMATTSDVILNEEDSQF
ncbi:MAG: hypothetical protein RIT04_564 [Candidatus Parcubacteria bacterium]